MPPDFTALGGRSVGPNPLVRLDLNNGPQPPPGFADALARRLGEMHLYGQERADQLRERIAAAGPAAVHPGCVVLGAGSMDLLRRAVVDAGDAGQPAIVQVPGYAGFRRLCAAMGVPVVQVARPADLGTATSALLAAVAAAGPAGALVYLNDPVNPVGTREDLTIVDDLLASSPASTVLVDEAYAEFEPGPSTLDISRNAGTDAVVVTRTFSKARSLAGIRLGYAVTGPGRAERWWAGALPGSVSRLTQAAGLAALDEDPAAFRHRMAALTQERDRVADRLAAALGEPPLPSAANFLLLQLAERASAYHRLAADAGIAVRLFQEEPGLPDSVRVTVGTREQNDRLLACWSPGPVR